MVGGLYEKREEGKDRVIKPRKREGGVRSRKLKGGIQVIKRGSEGAHRARGGRHYLMRGGKSKKNLTSRDEEGKEI